jgi:hypothetical protein
LREASGAGGQFEEVGVASYGVASSFGHPVNAGERFEGADQDASGLAFGFAGDIEAVVIAIDEIDIGVTGRAEEDGVAGGASDGGVGRGVVCAEISFHFDDAAREVNLLVGADEEFTEKIAGDAARIAGKEGAGKWVSHHDRSLFVLFTMGNAEGTDVS